MLAVLTTPSAALSAAGDLAQGIGTLVGTSTHCGNTTMSFDFTATGLAGTGNPATGHFSFTCSPSGDAFGGNVSCLVVNGNVATVGGTLTASTHAGFNVGDGLSFTVQDGGAAGAGDLFSPLRAGATCPFEEPFKPLAAGDIVVGHVAAPPQSTPATVVLSPAMATNDVGTSHTVTATATTADGTPSPNYTVFFTVTGSVAATGTCPTDAQGQCSFTYAGPAFPGADLIEACVDANKNGVVDTGEPCAVPAMKAWTLPATTPGEVTGGGWITKGGDKVAFGFIADSDGVGSTPQGHCNVIDHATKMHIKCLTIDALVVTPTHATFFGRATVGGIEAGYRIDVDDLGEPGTNDTFKILTDTGYVAAGTLQGGNIQIH
jgi:hypothetical protein